MKPTPVPGPLTRICEYPGEQGQMIAIPDVTASSTVTHPDAPSTLVSDPEITGLGYTYDDLCWWHLHRRSRPKPPAR